MHPNNYYKDIYAVLFIIVKYWENYIIHAQVGL